MARTGKGIHLAYETVLTLTSGGDSANLNSEENKIPANITGIENTNTATMPPTVGDAMRSKGNQYANVNPTISNNHVQTGEARFCLRSTIQFAISNEISNAEITIPLTCLNPNDGTSS